MDDAEIARFRSMLECRLAEIAKASEMGQSGQKVVTLDQQAIGRLSRQDALMHQSMAKATDARRKAEAQRIKAALNRIDAGEYGYCADCGEPIAIKRLRLDPATPKCISCAQG